MPYYPIHKFSSDIRHLSSVAQLMQVELRSGDDARAQMIQHINELIEHDFNRLISILYRIDVDEDKLKKRLREFPQVNAGEIILDMMVERQAPKPPEGGAARF